MVSDRGGGGVKKKLRTGDFLKFHFFAFINNVSKSLRKYCVKSGEKNKIHVIKKGAKRTNSENFESEYLLVSL